MSLMKKRRMWIGLLLLLLAMTLVQLLSHDIFLLPFVPMPMQRLWS